MTLYWPKQIEGIQRAVTLLKQEVDDMSDEMVHISEVEGCVGGLRVTLTSTSKYYYINEKGDVFSSRKELEDAEP